MPLGETNCSPCSSKVSQLAADADDVTPRLKRDQSYMRHQPSLAMTHKSPRGYIAECSTDDAVGTSRLLDKGTFDS